MKKDFEKLMELVKTDEGFQKKLEQTCVAYDGEKTEEAVFNNVLIPLAKEAGLSISFDDLKQCVQELNTDEMSQVAGGEGGPGLGIVGCSSLGFGIGGVGKGNPDPDAPGCFGGCIVVGYGQGVSGCIIFGAQHDFSRD